MKYAERAARANALADAASNPADRDAWRAAARGWETLSRDHKPQTARGAHIALQHKLVQALAAVPVTQDAAPFIAECGELNVASADRTRQYDSIAF